VAFSAVARQHRSPATDTGDEAEDGRGNFRCALKRIADFGWIRITSPGSQNEDASADGWIAQLSVVRVW
jgi:hypothetical protein